MTRALAGFSVFHALVLSVAEAARNWGAWQWWPFWTIDYVAALLLFVGGLGVLRTGDTKFQVVLASGWSFACAMTWMSFASHVEHGMVDGKPLEPMVYAAGFGLAVAGLCMVLSLAFLGTTRSSSE